jgi:hypothetical protein
VDGDADVCTAVEMSTCRQQDDAGHPQRANMSTATLTCAVEGSPQLPHR